MWEKLQASVVELSEARYQERQYNPRRRRAYHQASQALGKQVRPQLVVNYTLYVYVVLLSN